MNENLLVLKDLLESYIIKFINTWLHASILKKLYNDKLDDLVNKHNNTYSNTIKMKPVDIKPNTDINSSKEITDKDPTFKVCYIVRI